MKLPNALRPCSLAVLLTCIPLSGCTFISTRTTDTPPSAWVGSDQPCLTEAEFICRAGPVRDRWVLLDGSNAHINRHDVRTAGSRESSSIEFAFRLFPFTILVLPAAVVIDIVRVPQYISEALTASRLTQIYVLVEPVEGQYLVTAESATTYELRSAPSQSAADLCKLTWYDTRALKRICIPERLRRVPLDEVLPQPLPVCENP